MPPADNDAVSFLDDWVSALVRKGHWHGDFLTDAEFEALSARLRRYGLFVRCAHWSDVGVYYEAAAPGIDSMTGLSDWAALVSDLENAISDGSTFPVVLADVDRLGRIASLSSRWAERVVAVVARRLGAVAEYESCRLYRLRPNGDEFVALVCRDDAHLIVASLAEQLWRAAYRVRIPGYMGTTVIATARRDNEAPHMLLDRGMRLVEIVKARARDEHDAARELIRLTRIRPDEQLLWAGGNPGRS